MMRTTAFFALALLAAGGLLPVPVRAAPTLPPGPPRMAFRPMCQTDPRAQGGVVGIVVTNPDPRYINTLMLFPAGKDVDTYVSRLASVKMSRSFVAELPGGKAGFENMMNRGTPTIVRPDGRFACYGLAAGPYTLLAMLFQRAASGPPHITYYVSRVKIPKAIKLGSGAPPPPVTAPTFTLVGHIS